MGKLLIRSSVVILIHSWQLTRYDSRLPQSLQLPPAPQLHVNDRVEENLKGLFQDNTVLPPVYHYLDLQTKMRTIMTTKIVLGTQPCMCMHAWRL